MMSTASPRRPTKCPADPAVEAAAGRVIAETEQHQSEQHQSEQQSGNPQKKKSKSKPPLSQGEIVGAYSISDFCRAHGRMSESFFHKLAAEGRGPKLMKVGKRTMISTEAAAAWRRARESTPTTSTSPEPA
jgi:hypothetical protein